ncbi:MAG: hypothetical protein FJX62_23050 [Alphaproteobacteria bacterium]|nr:hypothetical protein [Alphaproteobacteria bacterium]
MVSTSNILKNKAKSVLAATAGAALLALAATPGQVEASSSPFTALSGNWSGAGTITMASGAKERIRCRAAYNVDGSGSNLGLLLRCASDSFKFELQSNVAHSNGQVTGNWAELTRRVGGNIEGQARGGRIQVRVSGTISAMLAVNTNANKQSISIEAPGSEMSAVAISLNRG